MTNAKTYVIKHIMKMKMESAKPALLTVTYVVDLMNAPVALQGTP